ncbi:MAG: chitin disaccharide deacetylase [Bacilli bacterium]|nr:chitin disaccharide deacetylase [Bacilli bacterium]
MKLIVNADDFGLSQGVNEGIILAHKYGIVSSTSVMVNMKALNHAVFLSEKAPNLKLGLHLNMTLGKPLTDCPSLVKPDGSFYRPKEKPNISRFRKEEIEQEFLAQYDLFISKFNKKPTHLDSHLYAHQIYEIVKEVVYEISEEKNVPVRDLETKGYKRVHFINWFKINSEKNEDKSDLLNKVFQNKDEFFENDISELMVHPAIPDKYLLNSSTYNKQRLIELEVLTDKKIKQFIIDNKITLTNFGEASICRK